VHWRYVGIFLPIQAIYSVVKCKGRSLIFFVNLHSFLTELCVGAAGLGQSDGKLMVRPSHHQARPGLMGAMAAMIDRDKYFGDNR
jgi:hypothetical protein